MPYRCEFTNYLPAGLHSRPCRKCRYMYECAGPNNMVDGVCRYAVPISESYVDYCEKIKCPERFVCWTE